MSRCQESLTAPGTQAAAGSSSAGLCPLRLLQSFQPGQRIITKTIAKHLTKALCCITQQPSHTGPVTGQMLWQRWQHISGRGPKAWLPVHQSWRRVLPVRSQRAELERHGRTHLCGNVSENRGENQPVEHCPNCSSVVQLNERVCLFNATCN